MLPARSIWMIAVASLVACVTTASAVEKDPPEHDREFWRGIAASEYAVPEGESALDLIHELSSLLGSRDAEERDTFGYSIPAHWIYGQELFTRQELLEILALWTGNLQHGIGETGTDTVLLRSFSALDLSIVAALDNKKPFLDEQQFGKLLDATLTYFHHERDVRGYVDEIGWLHSVAHTADVLKFLGRSRHLQKDDQARILRAVSMKMQAPDDAVYTFGEDERMARAVLSLLHRDDLDQDGFDSSLGRLIARAEGLWEGTLDPARFATVQNTKNLLRSLFVLLSAEAEGEASSDRTISLRSRVLAALGKL